MIEEKLTYREILALKVDKEPPNTIQGLRYRVAKHCWKNSLPLPAGKRGRKEKDLDIKLKEIPLDLSIIQQVNEAHEDHEYTNSKGNLVKVTYKKGNK